MIVFECASCGAALTKPLHDEPVAIDRAIAGSKELVQFRRWSAAEGDAFTWRVESLTPGEQRETEGPLCRSDDFATGALASTAPQHVGSSTYGCCGYNGRSGPNHECAVCRATVGILVDDCAEAWNQMRFIGDAVRVAQIPELDIAATRAQYLPKRIRTLFIAEAPPDDSWRFFYNDDVRDKDGLYLHLMRAVLGLTAPVADLRRHKGACLGRFRDGGNFLIDAVDDRLPASSTPPERVRAIAANADAKVAEARALLDSRGEPDARLVLIKATVYEALVEPMRAAGLPVANAEAIPFPGSGQQKRFLVAMERLGGWPEQPDSDGPQARMYGAGWLE